MDLFDLTGRSALVTGGGRGLGRGMAVALAQAGANVAVTSRTQAQLGETLAALRAVGPGGRHLALPCDVADLDALEATVTAAAAHYGRLDVLVNAAGVQVRKPSLEVTPADYDSVMSVQLRAAYFAGVYAARIMKQQGAGKIIHVASLTTAIGSRNVSIYSAAKSGIAGVVRSTALEWAPLGIQVNGIGPGYFKTELTEALFQDPERVAWINARVPAGRTGLPNDLAGAAVFLASPASDYVTGQILYVDGGFLAG
ncbi:MAG TPA: SDR family oxidoreductase [Symbiobacteriaceae bacterium]|nr:SDR family oxidoreductase [Symbiobacteriaceae bacterium]